MKPRLSHLKLIDFLMYKQLPSSFSKKKVGYKAKIYQSHLSIILGHRRSPSRKNKIVPLQNKSSAVRLHWLIENGFTLDLDVVFLGIKALRKKANRGKKNSALF